VRDFIYGNEVMRIVGFGIGEWGNSIYGFKKGCMTRDVWKRGRLYR